MDGDGQRLWCGCAMIILHAWSSWDVMSLAKRPSYTVRRGMRSPGSSTTYLEGRLFSVSAFTSSMQRAQEHRPNIFVYFGAFSSTNTCITLT